MLCAECVGPVASRCWCLIRVTHAPAIQIAVDVGEQHIDLQEFDIAVANVIAYHRTAVRDGLKDIFGRDTGRDPIERLYLCGSIKAGPWSPCAERLIHT